MKLTQRDQIYRLLNGAMSPMPTKQLATTLNIPQPSVRRELFHLRELQLLTKTELGWQLAK